MLSTIENILISYYFLVFFSSSTAPSILPKYIWSFQHVDLGVVRDSEPKLMVHGVYQTDENSLRLLPADTWIDVGDYRGLVLMRKFFS